jgi:YD repeat-containing protein
VRQKTLHHAPSSALIEEPDPLGRTVHIAYNSLSECTDVTDPPSNQTAFTDDGNGNRLAVTDANQHTTRYTNDHSMDRPISRTS